MSKKKTTKTETEFLNGNAYETVITASKEQMEKAMKATTEAAERVITISKDRLDAAVKGYDDAAKFGKSNVEAIVAAGNLATKGVETLNAEVLSFAKSQYEDNLAAAKAMMGAKTLQELVELQNDFTKTAFEAYAAHATKLSEVAAKVAQDAFAPINAQVQTAVEKFVKPLAA